jgi:hypothetical protein
MGKIHIVRGSKKSLIDGVTRQNISDDSFYYLDNLLLLQTSFDLETMRHSIIVKQDFLTFEEKEILDRLLVRLNLKIPENKKFILYGSDGWLLE